MSRGFTFLELLITISVLSILLAVAAPSFRSITQTVQMQRLATELNGFLIQAKSEAVKRNIELFAHISINKCTIEQGGNWSLTLTDSPSVGSGTVIQSIDGKAFHSLSVRHNYSTNKITFEEVRGRPKQGRFQFYLTNDSNINLNAVTSSPPGRVKICSKDGPLYDYPECVGLDPMC